MEVGVLAVTACLWSDTVAVGLSCSPVLGTPFTTSQGVPCHLMFLPLMSDSFLIYDFNFGGVLLMAASLKGYVAVKL